MPEKGKKEKKIVKKRPAKPINKPPVKKMKKVEAEPEKDSSKSSPPEKKKKLVEKKKFSATEIITSNKVKVLDVSRPTMQLDKNKYLLGDRYTVQVGQVNMKSHNYSFDSLIFTRDAPTDNPDNKKAYSFNMPAKLIIPLRDAIVKILSQSEENA